LFQELDEMLRVSSIYEAADIQYTFPDMERHEPSRRVDNAFELAFSFSHVGFGLIMKFLNVFEELSRGVPGQGKVLLAVGAHKEKVGFGPFWAETLKYSDDTKYDFGVNQDHAIILDLPYFEPIRLPG